MLGITALANTPTSINVQGRLTDGSGNPLPPGIKSIGFRIFDQEAGGTQIWPGGVAEVQSITSTADGLWTAYVGALEPLTDSVFADSVRWLEIAVDDGVNPLTVLPRVRLVTGPYAHRVSSVDGATGGTITSKISIGPGHSNLGAHAFVAGESNAANGSHAVISGGVNNIAPGQNSVIGGGEGNRVTGDYAVIGGGGGFNSSDSNLASGSRSTISGGRGNHATAVFAVVSGGSANEAEGLSSTIGGGEGNIAGHPYAVVSGGTANTADSILATISGGLGNYVSGRASTIGGGEDNSAGPNHATVAGGFANNASRDLSCIGGGKLNATLREASVVAGGLSNSAGGAESVVGGGANNRAFGRGSVIPGGAHNYTAGDYSFAGGKHASVLHAGSFLWNGNNSDTVASTDINQFLITAEGGVGINTNEPEGALDVRSGPNGIGLYLQAGTQDIAWPSGQNLQLGQWDDSTFTERARFTGTGRLGLNVTSVTNVLTLPNDANVGGRGLANRWDTYSSRRWKHDIVPLDSALALVGQLQGVRYRHNSDNTSDIGLIAEDVGAVIPEIVQYEDNGVDARSVDYARLVAVLIEAVKEQQIQIHQMARQLDQLTQ
ncbi:MAG: hypothetical protein GF341_11575 [candidate division Zixibacteria bacterium]|nr:hypothetical protein [candidate division Zixibacteria bacterium]